MKKQVNIRLDENKKKWLCMIAAARGETIKQAMESLIEDYWHTHDIKEMMESGNERK